MFDCHIHMMGETDRQEFIHNIREADVSGAIVLSYPPKTFDGNLMTTDQRLDCVLKLVDGSDNLFPFYFIDPLEPDACHQVDHAISLGISGFKIICIDDYPDNPNAMNVYKRIAYHGKPILFHSGILWNGKNSSNFNRPANFECLIEVEGLRFSLAHVSWPWYDECFAVFGKFIAAKKFNKENTMYFDLTPGTPEIYRREVLTKLFTIGYDVEDYVLWGSDNLSENYNIAWAKRWKKIDDNIFTELNLTQVQKEKIYNQNPMHFLKIDR